MNAEIIKGSDDNGVPYIELRISAADDFYEISFRRYPVRVFVAVEDNRDNPSGGSDLDDCWIAPVVVIDRVLHSEFDPLKSFILAQSYLGNIHRPSDPSERDYDYDLYMDIYSGIQSKVEEWRNTS